MGIKIRNCDPKSNLKKLFIDFDIARASSETGLLLPVDLSDSIAIDRHVPVACYLEAVVLSHDADFTASTGLTIAVSAIHTSACLVATGQVWSASDSLGFGVDWSAHKPVIHKVNGSPKLISANSVININVSAVSGTKSVVNGMFIFRLDDREEK